MLAEGARQRGGLPDGRALARAAAATAWVTSLAGVAAAQDRAVRVPRITEPPALSQIVDRDVTPPGVRISGFRQREPGDGTPASVPTDVYLSYDQKHLYAVFVCGDDPTKVRANMTKREAMLNDDLVGLILDTYHDGRRAYMFFVNPLGIQADGVSTEGQDDDFSYDALWASDGRLTDDGFVVLMAIPFKSLRFSSESTQTWGFAVTRGVQRLNEASYWPYITNRISGFGQQLATLDGLEGISPGRNLQAIPYGNFAADRVLGDDGYVRDRVARVGLDAKAVVKDAVTVDVTVNPDYSQVESDEPQVTINQRFEVFFPEKRPFFIENAGYFETPANLFFSRRIIDPRFGTRVTGRVGGWAFGGLAVNDEAPGRLVDEGDPRFGSTAGIGVVRVQREFARQSYLGGLFTDREWGQSANRVASLDGRWKLNDTWSVTGQWIGSRTVAGQEPDLTGSALLAEVSHDSRSLRYESSYQQFSPGFRSDLGFIRRVDIRETSHEVEYSWYPTDSPILQFGPGLEVGAIWDWGGAIQDWSVEPGFEIELAGQTMLMARHWQTFERFEDLEFRRHSTMLLFESEWLKWLSASARVEWGTGINYYPAEGLAPFLADSAGSEIGVTLKPVSRLRVDQSYLYTRLATRTEEGPPGVAEGQAIFANHILRTRATYQFTRELSLRAILDYESVQPDRTLVDLEREKRLGVDLLVTYLVNPWTAVYVGYTDRYENWQAPVSQPAVRSSSPTTSVGRQAFVKLSYLFAF
jgi:hypothetical protein